MSEVGRHEAVEILVPPFNAHVFRCPYCKDYTTLLSALSFISLEHTECENCREEFVIQNDAAHPLEFLCAGNQ